MKRFLSLLMMVAMLAVAFVVPASAEEVVEVNFWHSMSGNNGTVVETLCQKFNETVGAENGIKVIPTYQGAYADVTTKIHAMFAAEDTASLPEILQSPASEIGFWINIPEVVDLDTLAAEYTNINIDDLLANAVEAFSYQGRHIGVPFANSSVLFYYNKTAFEEAGITEAPKTIAELADACAKLVQKDDAGNITRHGFSCAMDVWRLNSFIGGQTTSYGDYAFIVNNGNGYQGLATEVVFDEDGTMAELMTEWKKLYDIGEFKYIVGDEQQEFAAGAICSWIGSSASLRGTLNAVGDKFEVGVAYLPKVDAADRGSVAVGGSALYVLDNGAGKIAEAAKFVEFMTSAENQYDWHIGTGYYPINNTVYDLPVMDTYLEENPLFGLARQQVLDSNPIVHEICTSVTQNLEALVKDYFAMLIEDEFDSIEEAVEELAAECDAILATVEA